MYNPLFQIIKSNKIMLYQLLLLWILSFAPVDSSTQLSQSNCPSKFYIKLSNVTNITKQQFKSYAKTFYSVYDTADLKSSIDEIVVKGNQKQLRTYVMKSLTPYLVIIVLFFVFLAMMCICCTFSRSCPPDCLKRDPKKNPYTLWHFRIITILSATFTVGILISGLLALSFIPQLKKDMALSTCGIYVTLDSVLNGQDNTGWGGFNNLYSKIGNVTQYLSNSLSDINSYLSGDQWLVDQMQILKTMNLDVYKNNKDSRLLSPNPTAIQTALDNNQSIPTIQSRFVAKGMGPNGTKNTMVDDIDKGLRTTQVLSKQAYQIQISAKRLIDSNSTLLMNANASRKTMQMYISQLNKTKESIDTFKFQYLNTYFQSFLDGLQGLVGILIIGGLASLIGIFAVYLFQIFTCKSMVQLSWALYGIGFIGAMGLLFITLGMGSLGYGFCNYFDSMIYSQSDFVKLGASDSQNPFNRLDSCFYGDGNVLSKFSIAKQMATVTQLFKNINTYYDYEDSLSTSFIDKTISTGKISNWMSIIRRYQKGIYLDYNQSITTDDNPNYSLRRLALYTKNGTGFPICAKDHWVFDATNCTQPGQTLYIASDADNGKNLQMTNSSISSICISFNQKFSTLMNNIWSQSDFTQRYTQTRKECADAYDKILFYGYALINFRDSRQNLFKGIYDQLDSIYNKNSQFNINLTNFKNKLYLFENVVTNLSNAVNNPINGLLVSSDCRPIVDNLKFAYNMFCINTMYDFIKIGWCCIFLCVFSFLGVISSYFFSSWFGDVQKNTKLFEQDYNPEVDNFQISSQTVLKQKKIHKQTSQKDIGQDFQKLGQFTTYIGVKKQNSTQKQKKKAKDYNSDDSSEQQNPYAMEFNE